MMLVVRCTLNVVSLILPFRTLFRERGLIGSKEVVRSNIASKVITESSFFLLSMIQTDTPVGPTLLCFPEGGVARVKTLKCASEE